MVPSDPRRLLRAPFDAAVAAAALAEAAEREVRVLADALEGEPREEAANEPHLPQGTRKPMLLAHSNARSFR